MPLNSKLAGRGWRDAHAEHWRGHQAAEGRRRGGGAGAARGGGAGGPGDHGSGGGRILGRKRAGRIQDSATGGVGGGRGKSYTQKTLVLKSKRSNP